MSYYTQWNLYGKGEGGKPLTSSEREPLCEALSEIADEWHCQEEQGEFICAFMTDHSTAYADTVEILTYFSSDNPNTIVKLECHNEDEDWRQIILFQAGEREELDGYIAFEEPMRINYDRPMPRSDAGHFWFDGLLLDRDLLPKKDAFIHRLRKYGANYRGLSMLREQQVRCYRKELVFHYPISESVHLGGFLTPVREGVLWLPYDEVHRSEGEQLLLKDARLLTEDDCEILCSDIQTCADTLHSALGDAAAICRQTKQADTPN